MVSDWLTFVKAHKNMRTANGLLDLKAISKLWHMKSKTKAKSYDTKSYREQLRESMATMEKGILDIHGKEAEVELLKLPGSSKWRATIIQPINRRGEAQIFTSKPKLRKIPKFYDPKPKHWYDAMVKGIKSRSDVRNPYAIVNNIWAKLSPAKKAQIRAREAKGERFKYDLPLPDDRSTKGVGTLRMVKPFKLAEVQVNLNLKDYLAALASGLFSKMKREDGSIALVARCKSAAKNCNIFIDKVG